MGFHSSSFSTHENQCGSCAISEVSDRRLDCYCQKYRRTYRLSEPKCRDYIKDRSRNYDFWRRIYTYYILTAVCDILGISKDNAIYQEIMTLISLVREDVTTVNEANEYDTVGPVIADRLRNDLDNINISNFIFNNYLVNVYCLIKLNRTDEAIELYKNMVEFLMIRYRNNELEDSNNLKK